MKKFNILAEEATVSSWLSKRRFLFRIVDKAYVEIQQPAAGQSKDDFLDKVVGRSVCCVASAYTSVIFMSKSVCR